MTPLHYSLFALEPQHGPSFSLSLLMQVHEAAAVVESGGDAGDAVAIRCRLCGGEGPVGVLEEVRGGGPVETPVHQVESYELTAPSTLPVGDATDSGMDYLQPKATLDLYVNVLVRPTRISPRQSGAAGPCTVLSPT